MANVRLRIAGLYFNEIVSMNGRGPWTVKDVMHTYKEQAANDPSLPKLEFQPDSGESQIGNTGSMAQIAVTHPADTNGDLFYKFYTFEAPDIFSVNANTDGTTLDRKRRRAGTYSLRETLFDGGNGVMAWQYYVQADNGEGVNRSKTPPQTGFTPFGDPAARIVEAGDLVTWRNVAILLEPIRLPAMS